MRAGCSTEAAAQGEQGALQQHIAARSTQPHAARQSDGHIDIETPSTRPLTRMRVSSATGTFPTLPTAPYGLSARTINEQRRRSRTALPPPVVARCSRVKRPLLRRRAVPRRAWPASPARALPVLPFPMSQHMQLGGYGAMHAGHGPPMQRCWPHSNRRCCACRRMRFITACSHRSTRRPPGHSKSRSSNSGRHSPACRRCIAAAASRPPPHGPGPV